MGLFDNYEDVACATCGLPIIMRTGDLGRLKFTGAKFFCSRGHENAWTGELDKAKADLRKMTTFRDNAVSDRDDWKRRYYEEQSSGQRMARRISALQGVITRTKKAAQSKKR